MIKETMTSSEKETFNFGFDLGKKAKPGTLFAITGELGTGKTIIAKGIAMGMGIVEDITSPTFTLMEIYENKIPLYHFDLYRINSIDEFDNLFFDEYWEGDGVSIVEWADRAEGLLPDNSISVNMFYTKENDTRKITIEQPDN